MYVGGAAGYYDSGANSNSSMIMAFDNGTSSYIKTSGNNSWGQLGTNNWNQYTTPYQINIGRIQSVAYIGGGPATAYVLLTNGSMYAWGYNGVGQLGDGTTNSNYTPRVLLTNVSKIV